MSSLRRILASRANGARSRGPVTPRGKERSAQNSLQHGLTARAIVIKGESGEIFQAYLDRYVARFSPIDEIELQFVEEMAAAAWRLRRAWSIEGRLFDARIDDQSSATHPERIAAAFNDLAAGPQFGLMHRYETRLHMVIQRALNGLLALQQARMQNEPSSVSEHELDMPGDPSPKIAVEDLNNRNYNEVVAEPPTDSGAERCPDGSRLCRNQPE